MAKYKKSKARTKKRPGKKPQIHFGVSVEEYAIVQQANELSIGSGALWQREAIMREARKIIRESQAAKKTA